MEEKKKTTLYVPNNIRTGTELMDGFGIKELIATAIVTGISVAVAFLIYGITGQIYQSMILILITAATTFMAVKKNEINQSIISMINIYFQYSKHQQQYDYKYSDPFADILKEEN